MPNITNTIFIERSMNAVFDVATTTKYWPIWHPQCLNVRGDTENPIQLNEKSSELVKLGFVKKIVDWTCTLHERPNKLRLDGTTRSIKSYIEYTFKERDGGTEFTRFLHYKYNWYIKPLEILTKPILKRHQKESMRSMKELLLEKIPK